MHWMKQVQGFIFQHINVPEKIVKMEEKIEKTKEEKIVAVKSQNFELGSQFQG